jgi:hypothetical protein
LQAEIGRGLPGRAGKACRERFVNHLDPHLLKAEWTTEEDAHLIRKILGLQPCNCRVSMPVFDRHSLTCSITYPSRTLTGYAGLVSELGEAWADIARRLPGRAEGSIKNRFNRLTGRRKKSFHPKALDLKAAVTAISRHDIKLAIPPRGAPSVLWTVQGSNRKRLEDRGAAATSAECHVGVPHTLPRVIIQKSESCEDRAEAAAALAHMGTTPMTVPTHSTAALPSHAAPGIQVAGVKRRRSEDGAPRVHDRPFSVPSNEPFFSSPLPFPPHHMYPSYPPGQWVYALPPTHPMPYHGPDMHMAMSHWSKYGDWYDAGTQRLPSPMVYRPASTGGIDPSPASVYGVDTSLLPFPLPPPVCTPNMAHIRGQYTHGTVAHTQAYEPMVYTRTMEGYS